MIKDLYVGGRRVNISFRHRPPVTYCYVSVIHGNNSEEYSDFAFCSDRDQFNKEKGRVVALTRTLKSMPLTKSGRTKIWKAYFGVRERSNLVQMMYIPEMENLSFEDGMRLSVLKNEEAARQLLADINNAK
jgi:hypothetical protein